MRLTKRLASLGVAAVALLAAAGGSANAGGAFTLTSTDIAEGQTIKNVHVFNSFGCNGENKSPQLSWANPPDGTKSFALTVYDPDAPTGSGWWHWVMFNIPPDTTSLARGVAVDALPKGAIQSKTDFGSAGYGGPCPPQGDKSHRYIFTISALKVDKLDADANASPALIGYMTHFNTLGQATLTAMYGR
jgi:Raf kinase inhibitor-like YbhB/YbcL family protein